MPLRKALLVLTAVLFAGWMGYLIHLALTHRHSTVLSRPQFLVSQLVVVAHFDELDELKSPVPIKTVLSELQNLKVRDGDKIEVTNLSAANWSGPGDYLLPLQEAHDGSFIVTPIPRSPGYVRGGGTRPLIYPWTAETKDQFNHIPKPEAAAAP